MMTDIPFRINVVAQTYGRMLLRSRSAPGRVREARTVKSASDAPDHIHRLRRHVRRQPFLKTIQYYTDQVLACFVLRHACRDNRALRVRDLSVVFGICALSDIFSVIY